MSWFSTKTATPARSTIRQQEIGLLQRTMRDLQWTSPDETCVKTLSLPNCTLSLSIHIPQDFPQKPPVLRLLTPARHQWVDSQGFLGGCPAISNWNVQSPSLVSLIQFIETKFRENPPVAQPQQQQQPQPQQGPPAYGQPPQYGSNPPYQQPPPGVYNPNQSYGQGMYQSQQQPGYNQPPGQQNRPPMNMPVSPTNTYNYNPSGGQPTPQGQPPMYQSGQPSPMNQSMSQNFNPQGSVSQNSFDPRGSMSQNNNNNNNNNNNYDPRASVSQNSQSSQHHNRPAQDIAAGPRYLSTGIQRPTTPTSPPEPPVDLAPIPPQNRFDPQSVRRLPLNKLEELDNDPDNIKLFVAQQPTISTMYEDLVKIQFDIEELEAKKSENVEAVQTVNIQYSSLKDALNQKEAEFQKLKAQYDQQVKKYSVQAFIIELQQQLDQLDNDGDELTQKFSHVRNPDEQQISDHLFAYEQNRRIWYAKSIVYERLKQTYK